MVVLEVDVMMLLVMGVLVLTLVVEGRYFCLTHPTGGVDASGNHWVDGGSDGGGNSGVSGVGNGGVSGGGGGGGGGSDGDVGGCWRCWSCGCLC